ncbi:MAG: GntR family transcriptional regulator [bacterium]
MWDFNTNTPIYLQIVEILKAEIIAGTYKPSEKFPSVRELAIEASVNPNTMQKALATLEREGFLITNRTSGRVVTNDLTKLSESKIDITHKTVLKFAKEMNSLGYDREGIIELINEIDI